MTYLEIVNRILRRLREDSPVSTVTANSYSTLIGDLVNVVKREVEDAWNWSVLRDTLTATTIDSYFNYVLENSGTRFRIIDVINDTSNLIMKPRPLEWFNKQFLLSNVPSGAPMFYNFNGVDSNGDTQIDVYPIPDGAYTLRFNMVLPQADLENDTDAIQVPANVVIEGVIARALSERGEDGGLQEQEIRYRNMLSDMIAIEAGSRPEETVWYPN
jgi:hypothetical protein